MRCPDIQKTARALATMKLCCMKLLQLYAEKTAEFQHYKDFADGLWCTDREDWIPEEHKDDFFQLGAQRDDEPGDYFHNYANTLISTAKSCMSSGEEMRQLRLSMAKLGEEADEVIRKLREQIKEAK